MSEAKRDTGPPMLIATRFGLGIQDPDWFEHRLALLSSITAPSLQAQDDQRFEWAVFVDSGCPEECRTKLEMILARFGGRAYMDMSGHNPDNLLALAQRRGLVSPDGHVFTGRIDDDDAWDRQTIGAVRERLASWREREDSASGFCMTFESGLVWIMYDMLDVHHLQKKGSKVVRESSVRPYAYPFTSISGFVYSRLSDGLTSISTGHPKLGEFLSERNFHVESVASDRPMWLYCRHKQTTSPIGRAFEADSLDLTLSELRERFGIDDVQVRQYMTRAYNYDYSRIGHWEHRSELRVALKAVIHKMGDPRTGEGELAGLEEERKEISEELKDLAANVMSGLEETDVHV